MNILNWLKKLIQKLLGKESINEIASNPNNQGEVTMRKTGLCVGINNYPGTSSDLSGCINDCNDWADILQSKYGFSNITKLIDSQATRASIKQALTKLVEGAVSGDIIVFTYSGHGSFVVDTSGDEPDGKDETLYTYDGNILDDELREILNKVKEGVKTIIILDSCHSGTATRVSRPGSPKPRFMPPSDPDVAKLGTMLPSSKAMLADENMNEVLLTGCKSTEYSYDAEYNGRPNGALTKTAIDALNKLDKPTYQIWYDTIRKGLPSSNYPQTPQLEGAKNNKSRIVFT